MRSGTRTNMQYVKNIDTRIRKRTDTDAGIEWKRATCESCERWYKMLDVWNLLLLCTCLFPFLFIFCFHFFFFGIIFYTKKAKFLPFSSVCSRSCTEKHTKSANKLWREENKNLFASRITWVDSVVNVACGTAETSNTKPNIIPYAWNWCDRGVLWIWRRCEKLFSRRFFSLRSNGCHSKGARGKWAKTNATWESFEKKP